MLDAKRIEVDLATNAYEGSGVVENDDGTFSRGYKLGTLRTLLDTAGPLTQVAVSGVLGPDLEMFRPLLESRRGPPGRGFLILGLGFFGGGRVSLLENATAGE